MLNVGKESTRIGKYKITCAPKQEVKQNGHSRMEQTSKHRKGGQDLIPLREQGRLI